MTDAQFLAAEAGYLAHMRRFIGAHAGQPQGSILIELERRERWAKAMGPAAEVLDPPSVAAILAPLPDPPKD